MEKKTIETPDDITKALKELATAFKSATDWIDRAKKIQKVQWGMLFIGGLALLWILSIAHNAGTAADNAKKAADAVQRQQITICQANNDFRSGARYVWDTLWDIFGSGPDVTKKDANNLRALKNFTDSVYADRDCSNPNRKYDFPDKPKLQ